MSAVLAGWASTRTPVVPSVVQLPLHQGWFDGEEVFDVTTDVSDAVVAASKQANHVLRAQEQVLAAADTGDVKLSMTTVVLNCPIVQRGARDTLPGVSIAPR